VDESETQSDMAQASVADQAVGSMGPPPAFDSRMDAAQAGKPAGFDPAAASLGQGNPLIVQQATPATVTGATSLSQCMSSRPALEALCWLQNEKPPLNPYPFTRQSLESQTRGSTKITFTTCTAIIPATT
jgi:hypothetical protein